LYHKGGGFAAPGSKGSEGSEGDGIALGHTCGVRVQKVQRVQRVQRVVVSPSAMNIKSTLRDLPFPPDPSFYYVETVVK